MSEPLVKPDEAALFDTLFEEDALYDEDEQLAARDLPPRAWRVAQRAVDEVMEFSRLRLDKSWRQLREQVRRDRMAAAIRGSFESRPGGAPGPASAAAPVLPEAQPLFEEAR